MDQAPAMTLMHSDGVLDRIEFNEHGALQLTGFVGLGGNAARQDAPTLGLDRRQGELSVGRELFGRRDLAIADDPICLGHSAPS
jgi:hypothetical protein